MEETEDFHGHLDEEESIEDLSVESGDGDQVEDPSEESGSESEEEELDPLELRSSLQDELRDFDQLRERVEESKRQQRLLALQLVNATRAQLDDEKEQLKVEAEAMKEVERAKRKAQKEQEAATKAAALAKERREGKSVQSKFSSTSVAKKQVTDLKDDDAFEEELKEFIKVQQANRLYLTEVVSPDDRVRYRRQDEMEYMHIKWMDDLTLDMEQQEFDLIEKSSRRQQEVKEMQDKFQGNIEMMEEAKVKAIAELDHLSLSIEHLKNPLTPPSMDRPDMEQVTAIEEYMVVLEEEREAYDRMMQEFVNEQQMMAREDVDVDEVSAEPAYDYANQETNPQDSFNKMAKRLVHECLMMTREDIDISDSAVEIMDDEKNEKFSLEDSFGDADIIVDEEEEIVRHPFDRMCSTINIILLMQDKSYPEEDLLEWKQCLEAEKQWSEWEKEGKMRQEELNSAIARQQSLQLSLKMQAIDIAMHKSDLQFLAKIEQLEEELGNRLFESQADAQLERMRFMVERAARDESVFRLQDREQELQDQYERAERLPLQAMHPLERVELEEQSQIECRNIQEQKMEVAKWLEKELKAKKLLQELEERFMNYTQQRLEEEVILFHEKQELWNESLQLQKDLNLSRNTIEQFYSRLDDDVQDGNTGAESSGKNDVDAVVDATDIMEVALFHLQRTRRFLLQSYAREERWRKLVPIALIKDTTSHDWMTTVQYDRAKHIHTLLEQQRKEDVTPFKRQVDYLDTRVAQLEHQLQVADKRYETLQEKYQESSDVTIRTTRNIIHALKDQLQAKVEEMQTQLEESKMERKQLIEAHDATVTGLEARLLEQSRINETQKHWLTSSRRELKAQRIANEQLLTGYQALEKRRATEVNDMRFRINAQIQRIRNIEMWNLSLKLQSMQVSKERVQVREEIQQRVVEHKQQQKALRLQNWRQRVTAQSILTNVDQLFHFFSRGLSVLAGASPSANDALRHHAGIEVLTVLAKYSQNPTIKAQSARTLGQVAWNANITPRALGWHAKHHWFDCVSTYADNVTQKLLERGEEFDAVPFEETVEENWLADSSYNAAECDDDVVTKDDKKLRFIQTWNYFDHRLDPNENQSNQEVISHSPEVLHVLVKMCTPAVLGESMSPGLTKDELATQGNALRSLVLVARHAENTELIGNLPGAIQLLLDIIRPDDIKRMIGDIDPTQERDLYIVYYAIQALGNLAFDNVTNKRAIQEGGGVSSLLSYCTESTEVDILFASVQTLSYLSFDQTMVCADIAEFNGIGKLCELVHSSRVYDAVDLDVFEQIQTHAAETISHVIVQLDSEDNESHFNSMDVVSQVLQHHQHGLLDSSPDRGVISNFVHMCASCQRDVAFHGAQVLGSLAQHDAIRHAVGHCGGIDALFLLVNLKDDKDMITQALWALSNLTWNQDNQFRVMRYLDLLYGCSISPSFATLLRQSTSISNQEEAEMLSQHGETNDQIRQYALCIIANALYYNDANRRLIASQESWMQLLQHNCLYEEGAILEHSARAWCALTYSDSLALAFGKPPLDLTIDPNLTVGSRANGLVICLHLCRCKEQGIVRRLGVYSILNMCLHDMNKTKLLEISNGVDTLVDISGETDQSICNPALELLELLADLRLVQKPLTASSNAALLSTDLKKLISLLQQEPDEANCTVLTMVCDAIADEAWHKPSAKIKIRNEHGLERLLHLCTQSSLTLDAGHTTRSSLICSCLWALRNSILENKRNQDLVMSLDGIPRLLSLYDKSMQDSDVVESILATFIALVMENENCSQELVRHGNDKLISLAESAEDAEPTQANETTLRGSTLSLLRQRRSSTSDKVEDDEAQTSRKSDVVDLAKELLYLVEPYKKPSVDPTTPSTRSPSKMTKLPLVASPTRDLASPYTRRASDFTNYETNIYRK